MEEIFGDRDSGVFALGNFDGVHRGHQAVIAATLAQARAAGLPAYALTFEPHPRSFFHPGQPPFRLTPPPVKERLLRACGLDNVLTLPFTNELAQLSAQEFVERILIGRFRAQHIVAGHDFAFGRGRAGTMQNLADWLAPYGVGVTRVPPLSDAEGRILSSTIARERLQQGDTAAAAAILGRNWSICGRVLTGMQRGRSIGFPTANLALGDYLRPQFGVYAVQARPVGENRFLAGIANIGNRPTVAGTAENLEAHLFDFDRDIYGQEWEVSLTRFIRPECKFDSLDALKAQIATDVLAAKTSSVCAL